MALPSTQIKTGWYFHRPSSTFLDLYLGPHLTYLWRHIHREFNQYSESLAKGGKNWLYSYTKSTQALADEVGYGSRRQTVTEQIKALEAKGVLCRIPCASNNNQGKAIVTFDPASIGYESFVYDVVAELKKKSDEGGTMATEYLNNFMSDLTLWKSTTAIVNKRGDTVSDAISIITKPTDKPAIASSITHSKAPTYDNYEEIPDDAW